MIKKICLLTNDNVYESRRYFASKLSEALLRRNIEIKVIDIQENLLSIQELNLISHFAPDFTCSFNTLLPMSNHQFFWDYLEIPHLTILLEPALYSLNLTNSAYSMITSVDRFDCELLRSNGFKHLFFWPHAVEPDIDFQKNEERIYDVVFLGSCYDYETLELSWKEVLTDEQEKVLHDAIDLVLGDSQTSLSSALVQAWKVSKLSPTGVDFMTLFYYLDYYTRGKDRVDLIYSIQDAHVHVFGEKSQDIAQSLLGWSQYLVSQPNVTVHPSVSFADSYSILKKSKICLNSMPFFKNGSHERIFTSLACGALPLTSDNIFVREHFEENREILLYQSTHLEEVNDKINEFLANESKRKEAAALGRTKVMAKHTWDRRVDDLLNFIPLVIQDIYK